MATKSRYLTKGGPGKHDMQASLLMNDSDRAKQMLIWWENVKEGARLVHWHTVRFGVLVPDRSLPIALTAIAIGINRYRGQADWDWILDCIVFQSIQPRRNALIGTFKNARIRVNYNQRGRDGEVIGLTFVDPIRDSLEARHTAEAMTAL